MQPRYVLMTTKDGDFDFKHSRNFESKEDLVGAFEKDKIKYNAKEDAARQSTMGHMGSVGLFKFAKGECKHGKKVELQYSEIENTHTCHPSMMGSK